MDFNEYQERAKETAIYPLDRGLEYVTLGLVSEAGEFAGKVKKIIRDDGGEITYERHEELAAELGDVLWYVAQTATEVGLSLSEVAQGNLHKLSSRAERGVIGGSGDNR